MRGYKAIFAEGRNCWRVAHADRATVIVDACDYYRVIRQAMLEARHRILIIGWDFDPRISLDRTDEQNRGETLGSFLLALAKDKPAVAIRILKWDVGALKLFGRGSAWLWVLRWMRTKAISFRLDHAHPTGCSHHQKIVVIDDVFAICGGIDMTRDRWDRPAHRDDDPDRVRPNGTAYGPWHDVTMAVDGAAARAIGDLACDRWRIATGEELERVADPQPIWPNGLAATFTDCPLAIARTHAEWQGEPEVREIEALFLDLIGRASRFIYIENQYFTSPKLAGAIARRMEEDDPPEIVLVMPVRADGWLEQVAMDAARVRLAQMIGRVDAKRRFRIYTPVTKRGDPIYVHAKLMIVDDDILKVGSANMNNRSLGLDSECDLALDGDHHEELAGLRTRLMAEHLGCTEEEVAATFGRTASLIGTIEALRGEGKTLCPLSLDEPSALEAAIADRELLDPVSPDAMFEDIARPSLFARFRRSARRAYSGRKSGTER